MKTTKEEIVQYWYTNYNESDLNVDHSEALERCWRCTKQTELERCHIIPKSLNNEDTPSNLVLLCYKCHLENPNVGDREYFINWLLDPLKYTYGLYDVFPQTKILSDIIAKLDKSLLEIPFDKELLKNLFKQTTIHFGKGVLNESSIKWVFEKYFQKISEIAQQKEFNQETIQAIEETNKGIGVKRHKNSKDLFEQLKLRF